MDDWKLIRKQLEIDHKKIGEESKCMENFDLHSKTIFKGENT